MEPIYESSFLLGHCTPPRTSTPIKSGEKDVSSVDPDWNPFPLESSAAFEHLEVLLSQSVEHRLALLDFFRDFLPTAVDDWLQWLKLIIKDEAVGHVTSFKSLEEYWVFTAIYVAFFDDDTNFHFSCTLQKFLTAAKRRLQDRIRRQSKRKALQTNNPLPPAKRLRRVAASIN